MTALSNPCKSLSDVKELVQRVLTHLPWRGTCHENAESSGALAEAESELNRWVCAPEGFTWKWDDHQHDLKSVVCSASEMSVHAARAILRGASHDRDEGALT